MKHLQLGVAMAVAVALVLGVGACGDREAAPKEPVKTEEEIRLEQEAAQRSEQAGALADRVAQAAGSAGELSRQATGGDLPETVEAAASGLAEKSAEVERLLGELQGAGADQWEAAKARLESALEELETAASGASSTLRDWQSREAAVLTARAEGESPIDPETGLIRGLDGGDYEPYKDSVIERVQEVLRRRGSYAGPVDGQLDRPLMEALGGFQTEQELQVSGVPSPMTRNRLFG